jgi:hypothetical protein
MVCYSAIGLSAAFAISDVPSNVSLKYKNFTFGKSLSERPLWTQMISYVVVLFPAFDLISIFPIASHAISDNIVSAFYGTNRVQILIEHKIAFYAIRVVSILPSFAYALVQTQLVIRIQGSIINNTGMLSFFLILIMIPMCHIAARYYIPVESLYKAYFCPNVSYI